jgi:hypothetical protein
MEDILIEETRQFAHQVHQFRFGLKIADELVLLLDFEVGVFHQSLFEGFFRNYLIFVALIEQQAIVHTLSGINEFFQS